MSDEEQVKPPMTQEEVENWIMLKGQTDERWFEIRILDEEVGQDPTMIALMETVSDMIFRGIKGMPFEESEMARAKDADAKPELQIVGKGEPPR
jgi:hypothetical protein